MNIDELGWARAEKHSAERRAEGLFNDNCTLKQRIVQLEAELQAAGNRVRELEAQAKIREDRISGLVAESAARAEKIRELVPDYMKLWAPLDAVRVVCSERDELRSQLEAAQNVAMKWREHYDATTMDLAQKSLALDRALSELAELGERCAKIADSHTDCPEFCHVVGYGCAELIASSIRNLAARAAIPEPAENALASSKEVPTDTVPSQGGSD